LKFVFKNQNHVVNKSSNTTCLRLSLIMIKFICYNFLDRKRK